MPMYIYICNVLLPLSTPTRSSELPKSADKSQLAQHPRKSEVVPAGPPPEEMEDLNRKCRWCGDMFSISIRSSHD